MRLQQLRSGARAGLAMLAVLACALPAPAHAQARLGTADTGGKVRAYRRVAPACRAEYIRFCPAPIQPTPQPRDEVICLKSYRADLSLGCRGAIDAVRK